MMLNRVNSSALILISSFPLIGMRFAIWLIILFALTSVISYIKSERFKTLFLEGRSVLILSSYYLLALISFFITQNIDEGLRDLETKAAFFVFPFFIFMIKDNLNKKIISKIILSFSVSNLILALYIWGIIFSKGIVKVLESDNYYNPIVRKIFSEVSGYHLPYLGLFFGFSCIIFLSFILDRKVKWKFKVIFLISILILVISMMFFTARMALFCTLIAFCFYGFSYLKKKTIIKISLIFLILAFGLSFLKPIKRRFYEMSNVEFKLPEMDDNSENVNFRLGIYYCAIETLENNWLLGLGLGNVQEELNNCYEGLDYIAYDDFVIKKFNTHNQYLNAWLTYGIFGPIFLFGYFFFLFKGTDKLHKSLIIIFFFALLTENLFEREAGVMLFAFLNTIFYYSSEKMKLIKLENCGANIKMFCSL